MWVHCTTKQQSAKKHSVFCSVTTYNLAVVSPTEQLYEQMTSLLSEERSDDRQYVCASQANCSWAPADICEQWERNIQPLDSAGRSWGMNAWRTTIKNVCVGGCVIIGHDYILTKVSLVLVCFSKTAIKWTKITEKVVIMCGNKSHSFDRVRFYFDSFDLSSNGSILSK